MPIHRRFNNERVYVSVKAATPSHVTGVSPSDKGRRTPILIGGGALALLLIVALIAWAVSGGPPRLNDPTVLIARFVGTGQFSRLPFDSQRQYMEVLDDREDETKAAFNEGKLTEGEYRTALKWAWMGEHLSRIQKYYALPPGQQRADFIERALNKKEKKKVNSSTPADKIKRDQSTEAAMIDALPPDVRSQWDSYQKAYRAARDAREKAAAQTRPAGS
jgi:hypothetical protein